MNIMNNNYFYKGTIVMLSLKSLNTLHTYLNYKEDQPINTINMLQGVVTFI